MSLVDDFNIKIHVHKFYEQNNLVYIEIDIQGDMFDNADKNLANFIHHPAYRNLLLIRQIINPCLCGTDNIHYFARISAEALIDMLVSPSNANWSDIVLFLSDQLAPLMDVTRFDDSVPLYLDLTDYYIHRYFTPSSQP